MKFSSFYEFKKEQLPWQRYFNPLDMKTYVVHYRAGTFYG